MTRDDDISDAIEPETKGIWWKKTLHVVGVGWLVAAAIMGGAYVTAILAGWQP
jgi:hypothetical protein